MIMIMMMNEKVYYYEKKIKKEGEMKFKLISFITYLLMRTRRNETFLGFGRKIRSVGGFLLLFIITIVELYVYICDEHLFFG